MESKDAFSSGRKAIVAMPGGLGAVAAIVHQQPSPLVEPKPVPKHQFKGLGAISKQQLVEVKKQLTKRQQDGAASFRKNSSDSSLNSWSSVYYKGGTDDVWLSGQLYRGLDEARGGIDETANTEDRDEYSKTWFANQFSEKPQKEMEVSDCNKENLEQLPVGGRDEARGGLIEMQTIGPRCCNSKKMVVCSCNKNKLDAPADSQEKVEDRAGSTEDVITLVSLESEDEEEEEEEYTLSCCERCLVRCFSFICCGCL